MPPVHYRSPEEDSARWTQFAARPGDIVVSTRSKSGTTWVQTICALLVHGTPDLPAPLGRLSPWLDWLVEPLDDVLARLDAQPHRRVVKTHTPLDGLPLDPGVTYVVVARHPLDQAVSLHHQGANLDRERVRALTGALAPTARSDAPSAPPLHDSLMAWVENTAEPRAELDSLPGVLWHLTDAWGRRTQPNVVLVHYADLLADLDGQMRRLAGLLGVPIDEQVWPALVRAATFDAMRTSAATSVPDPVGVLLDPAEFFRRGRSGAGAEVLSVDERAAYHARAAALAPADLLAWLHREDG